MPRTANTTPVTFQQKMKVLTKLYEGGCKTEKELQALELAEMLKIPNITVQELSIIVELQKSVKRSYFLFLPWRWRR